MSQHAAKGKEWSTSRDTTWSPWAWNSAGYWESSRTNILGEIEWRRDAPNSTQGVDAATPRSPPVLDNHSAPPDSLSSTNYGPSNSYYSVSNATPTGEYSSGNSKDNSQSTHTSWGQTPYPSIPYPSSSGHQTFSDPLLTKGEESYGAPNKVSESLYSNEVPSSSHPPHISPASSAFDPSQYKLNDFPTPSNVYVNERNIQESSLESDMSGLSFTTPEGITIRTIASSQHRSAAEKLDRRYHVISNKEAKSFWEVGRVFMMLWTEPAGAPTRGGTRNGSHISVTWLDEKAYSEIRRFVVIQDGDSYAQCLAIHTYGGWATLKPNLPDPDNHAVIYTSSKCPPQFSVMNDNGEVHYEQLTKDPIRVNSERKDSEGKLHPESRIDYSKIYRVKKDIRVLNIGKVAKFSLPALYVDSPLKPTSNVSSRSRNRSPYSHQHKASKAKDKIDSQRFRGVDMDEPVTSTKDADSGPILYSDFDVGDSAGKLDHRTNTSERLVALADFFAGYQIIGSPSRFFKKGRVFKALWIEPAGDVANTEDAFVVPSAYGENAFVKIRHFVVIREKQSCCLCLMLNTYHGQGATKDGIKAENYAAVYPLGGRAELSRNENLTKEPFPIKVEEAGESIDPASRIDFGRVYTVEHNIKVLKVGRIPNEWLSQLEGYLVSNTFGL
ncbi:hypothetical protein V8E51_010497 [Hyaloscypha variabilis]